MTISMAELQQALNTAYPAVPTERATVRKAFISDSAYNVGDEAYAAVVTADYIDPLAGTFEIVFDLLGWTGGYEPISLTINDDDIRAVREMLGIGHEIERPFSYNELLTPRGRDDLAVAMHALNAIAKMDDADPEDNRTWKTVALQCIDLATRAIVEIEAEADDD